MGLQIGIVGLPNVGKSTLFNALLKKQAALAANYPFATIEPNIGIVPVPDARLEKLQEIEAKILNQVQDDRSKWPPIKPATVEFVDIAGLVKGAAEGEGLGNKFLSYIREVNVIAHVVRVFEDADVIKEGTVSPKDDYETIRTELALADIETLAKANEKELRADPGKKVAVEKLKNVLDQGLSVAKAQLREEEWEKVREFNLLSTKREIIVLNVSEYQYSEQNIPSIIQEYAELIGLPESKFIVISAQIESELAALSENDQKEYLNNLGLGRSGLERLIKKAYQELGLISFLTAGEKEVRAWTIKKGLNAVGAAGQIHTDFIKNFIKAEIVQFDVFVKLGGWKKARELGKTRMEGRGYVIQEGDVVEFKIGR